MSLRTESSFTSSVLASGLTNPQQLDYALRIARHRQTQQGLAADAVLPDRLVADILIEQSALTPYQADQLLEGRTKLTLGPYLITDWIGQGGMGQVFKAIHQLMGRECAVKVLPLARATQESRDHFRREIRMQAGLDCPYLVRAFDAGQDGNVHYLVTEYVPGMDLRRLVKSRGPLPIQPAAKIIMHAALGLEYAHRQGLVHRDVKPGNILVTPSGDAKVSDVGLAGFAKDLMNDPRAGKIVGTTDYISPEQIRTPLEIQSASDIYSLGCTLYYAVCGKVPFPGGDTTSKLRRHLEETPWHPRRFAIDIPEDFVDIIADMMVKDPAKRIANAAEVASRLEPWVGEVLQVGSMSITRSPWMAPPPPSHDQDKLIEATSVSDTSLAEPHTQATWNSVGGSDGSLHEQPLDRSVPYQSSRAQAVGNAPAEFSSWGAAHPPPAYGTPTALGAPVAQSSPGAAHPAAAHPAAAAPTAASLGTPGSENFYAGLPTSHSFPPSHSIPSTPAASPDGLPITSASPQIPAQHPLASSTPLSPNSLGSSTPASSYPLGSSAPVSSYPLGASASVNSYPRSGSPGGLRRRSRLSTGMVIALTIAIVLPPALLLGAILGYLAK